MERSTVKRQFAWITAMLWGAAVFAGCDDRAPQPPEETAPGIVARQPQAEPEPADEAEPELEPTVEHQPGVPETEPEPLAEYEPSVEELKAAVAEHEAGPAIPEAWPAEPQTQPAGDKGESREYEREPAADEADKPPDLGPPLVKDPKDLIRLDKTRPVWADKAQKRVVMIGQICQREAMLELFACLRGTKEHEAIVSVDVEAATVHAGLVAMGAKPGSPARWEADGAPHSTVGSGQDEPAMRKLKYFPATGTEIEVTVAWKDKKGKRQTARAQQWILDSQTKKAMTHPWVFAGSRFWKDPETGKKHYQAEGGDLICVSNFPSAMLDLPIESSQATGELVFRALGERIPPLGTPVTLLLTPKPKKKQEPKEEKAPGEAEREG